MEELSLLEFFKRKYNGTLIYPISEEMKTMNNLSFSKISNFGTYSNIKSFEKIYNKYIKGKIYMPADDNPIDRIKKKRCVRFGFLINKDGAIDMVKIKVDTVKEFLNRSK